ncbi:hypothetical protein LY76DRAFT_213927 [Colletotrichum caudatum]|nr:hypothetical protein LY76DRAFT_213927 [Colletotrichum caudatum]
MLHARTNMGRRSRNRIGGGLEQCVPVRGTPGRQRGGRSTMMMMLMMMTMTTMVTRTSPWSSFFSFLLPILLSFSLRACLYSSAQFDFPLRFRGGGGSAAQCNGPCPPTRPPLDVQLLPIPFNSDDGERERDYRQ